MQTKKESSDVITGSPFRIFLKYSIPSVLALLCISSSGIVDAIFVGNYAGSGALAAINLVMPFYSLVFGVTIMLVTGSCVRCGTYIGQKKENFASALFTRTMIALICVAVVLTILGACFPEQMVRLLGANDELVAQSSLYLFYISLFSLVFTTTFALAAFVKVDGAPLLSAAGIIAASLLNVVLDALLVAYLDMGVKGAAIATGGSQGLGLVILLTHFFSGKNGLTLDLKQGRWKELVHCCYNGISEFTDEMSVGLLMLLFNWIMITRLGVDGVAAFTVVNYTLWCYLMVSYGINEAMLPVFSINNGAGYHDRVKIFLKIASLTIAIIGCLAFLLLSLIPGKMAELFLPESATASLEIAVIFTGFVKWAFLFSGFNIVISGYFTALQKPLVSMVISLSRSLLLPVTALLLLPQILSDTGIFIAVPTAEALTLLLSLFLLKKTQGTRHELLLAKEATPS